MTLSLQNTTLKTPYVICTLHTQILLSESLILIPECFFWPQGPRCQVYANHTATDNLQQQLSADFEAAATRCILTFSSWAYKKVLILYSPLNKFSRIC